MDTKKLKWRREIRKTLLVLIVCIGVYALSYIVDSFFGGYWIVPEMDDRDRWSFGLAMHTAFLWQPYLGHEAIGHFDTLGVLYKPLIQIDRRLVHPTIYLLDTNGSEIANLRTSQVHPYWRDEYFSKVTVTAVRDEISQTIKCTLHYANSNHPREITEIRISHQLADAMQVSAPEGFSLQALTNTYYKIVAKYDVVWTGVEPLYKDQDVIVTIPTKNPLAGAGRIVFYYARTDDSSGDFRGVCSTELK